MRRGLRIQDRTLPGANDPREQRPTPSLPGSAPGDPQLPSGKTLNAGLQETLLSANGEGSDQSTHTNQVAFVKYARFYIAANNPAATAEAWVDGHVDAFSFFDTVALSMLYDNYRCLVSRIERDGTRCRTQLFSGFLSHYLIGDRYGRPGKGNDKGAVEGLVGWSRRNFMVPLPDFASFEAFNEYLERRCRERQGDVLRGHRESIGERLKRDLEAMAALPAAPFDACHQAPGQVSSQSLVRLQTNDYSGPVAYGYQQVWVRGYVEQVVIECGTEIIARHRRSYEGEDTVFDPLHYLPLIERKIGALDQAAPLAGWELPDAFATLRRLMEARSERAGRREYVQVLRLRETFGLDDVHAAVTRRPKANPDLLGPPHPHGRGGSILLRPLVWFLSALDTRAAAFRAVVRRRGEIGHRAVINQSARDTIVHRVAADTKDEGDGRERRNARAEVSVRPSRPCEKMASRPSLEGW